MWFTVLYFEGCPNHEPVAEKLRSIITQHDVDAAVEEIEVAPEDAARYRFLGSPTVQVDGIDIEPAARVRTDFGMSCRVYDTPDGLPSEEMIVDALALASAVGGSPSVERAGRIAVGGSLVTALLSSACCWVPLLLLAFGASTAGASAFFERWRPWFITLALVSLGAGFCFVYLRKRASACCDDGVCDTKRGAPIGSQVMLWSAAALVTAFITFPKWGHMLIGDGQPAAITAAGIERGDPIVLHVDGMTCETCEIHLVRELRKLRGVLDVTADYENASAQVVATRYDEPGRDVLAESVERAGYMLRDIDPEQ